MAIPPGVNGALLDAILRHRHYLLRAENGLVRQVVAPLREARRSITAELARLAELEEAAITNLRLVRRERLTQLLTRVDEALAVAMTESQRIASAGFLGLAGREVEIQANLLRRLIPNAISLDLTGLDLNMLAAMLEEPLGGLRYAQRFQRNWGELTLQMQTDLAASVALGEGIAPAALRMRKSIDNLAIHRAVLIARSEIQRVANRTAQQLYIQNSDVIKGMMVTETLDPRTCLVCANEDGKFVPLNTSALYLPPFHAACRGFITPVTKSFREMGLDADEFPPATRASMHGQVPGKVTYREWFEDQSDAFKREWLGPTRYRLYRSGEVTIENMVRDLRILPIDELPLAA